MATKLLKVGLGAALLAGAAFGRPAEGALVITEALASTGHPAGTANADFFELTNNGPGVVNLTGYSWDDSTAAAGSAGFGPITSIGVNESIIITGETLGAEAAFRQDWGIPAAVQIFNVGGTNFQDLNATGDTINVYNASNVLQATQTFGSATTGVSFEWGRDNTSLGLSVAGQNGAYVAPENGATGVGTDVGSPGVTVVPEPSTLALVPLAGLLVARRRRSRRA